VSQKERDAFMRFVDWTLFYGLAPPVNGTVVAGYLLEMISCSDAPIEEVRLAAAVIKRYYREHRVYLDEQPIAAALELAEAQLSPGRTLN
jgi:hypothetical protein